MKKYFIIGLVTVFILVGMFSLDNNVSAVEEQNTLSTSDIAPIPVVAVDSAISDTDINASIATLVATKIVCDDEKYLPNWGGKGEIITEKTASDFLLRNTNCKSYPWVFEWSVDWDSNPGDNILSGGKGWNAFKNRAEITVPPEKQVRVLVREQMHDEYIPFSGLEKNDSISAEFYCNTDGKNYDNYESIGTMVTGEVYHCVGFNVLRESASIAVDGGWSAWSEKDNSCDASGIEIRFQKRTCTNPSPSNGGLACVGPNTQKYIACASIDDTQNVAPVADAGSNQTITLSTDSVTLDGSNSTDSDGEIVSYKWTMISGPSDFGPFNTASAYVDELIEGTYVFSLTVTDNDGASSSDTVSITVKPRQRSSSSGSYINRTTPFSNEGSVLGATTSCSPYLYTYIMYGANNNDKSEVMKLQQFLNEYLGYNLPIDGVYGLDSYNALKAFQLKHSQEVLSPWVGITLQNASKGTGFMYKTTQRWINMIKCPDLNLPMPMLP